ncbi:tetratricopeptide repeat protein [Nostoc sp. CENA67]|uniref:Tetratricopeptide repeat protein n=1 Tax=Amazonocrinis nigriterrae CENA67 TaxID=2794033 RepID=A0A8J7HYK4_9NOST|nr:tetratricopeptide repeat protein [Amazonocrinis nigriterrae]MBH8566015.1 tetratricopeptide repeat protein [Amazonocrinis nigriterrae CENA67]
MVEFVGRETELQNLHEMLQQNHSVAITAIAGMGGLGKTELALQYAMAHREIYNGGICWLSPRVGDVGIQIVQFARTHLDLNVPDNLTEDSSQKLLAQVQYCFRLWREGDVLLVLDDVSDYEQVKAYLPSSSSRFKVLMTTRQYFGGIAQLSLDVLQPEAALELLKSIIGAERIERENDLTPLPPSLGGKGEIFSPPLVGEGLGERSYGELVALQLCEWLGYLPLGLELVGRYLARKRDLSVTEMLRRLKQKRLDERSLFKSKSEANMTAQRSVLAAFELSWQELEDADQELGCLLSLFAAAPIPWYLVEQCLPEEDEEEIEEIRDDKLLNLHLLQRRGEGIYQLHPLLREFFQYKLTGLEQAEEFKRSLSEVMVGVAKYIPETSTLIDIAQATLAIPHLAEAATVYQAWLSNNDLISPFVGLARFYQGQGAYAQALPWREQCLSVARKRFGYEDPNIATSLNNLAFLYYLQGRYSDVEPLYIKALSMRKRLLGDEHPDVAQSLNNLALLYNSQGRYSDAELLFIEGLAMRERLLGDEHPDVAQSLNNLALLYKSQGRYTEAEPLYIQALSMRKRLLGDEHPDVGQSLNDLALLYKLQGRYSDAEPLHIEVLSMTKRLLGDEHPYVATSLNNLALLYDSQGRYSEAEPLYIEALTMWKRLLGNEHPDVAASLNNLAFVYKSQGRYSEAETLHIEALAMRKRLLGDEHPDVAQSLNNLAFLYSSQERYSEAEPLYIQALSMRKRLLGNEHPSVAISLNNLAFVYKSQGRYSEAETLYVQALDIWERRLGVNHPNTINCRQNLADLRDRLTSQ